MGHNSADAKLFSNISATTAAFRLSGGKYAAEVAATFGGGSVKLQTLLPDQSTWASIGSTTDFTANGVATVDLPPGQYRFTITTASAVFASIASAE